MPLCENMAQICSITRKSVVGGTLGCCWPKAVLSKFYRNMWLAISVVAVGFGSQEVTSRVRLTGKGSVTERYENASYPAPLVPPTTPARFLRDPSNLSPSPSASDANERPMSASAITYFGKESRSCLCIIDCLINANLTGMTIIKNPKANRESGMYTTYVMSSGFLYTNREQQPISYTSFRLAVMFPFT